MIRTNLSTRPFYNERSVRLILLAVAIVVVAFTAFNASRVLRYSRSDTRLATQASRDEARAADLRQQAVRLRNTVDPKQVDFASADARQANAWSGPTQSVEPQVGDGVARDRDARALELDFDFRSVHDFHAVSELVNG